MFLSCFNSAMLRRSSTNSLKPRRATKSATKADFLKASTVDEAWQKAKAFIYKNILSSEQEWIIRDGQSIDTWKAMEDAWAQLKQHGSSNKFFLNFVEALIESWYDFLVDLKSSKEELEIETLLEKLYSRFLWGCEMLGYCSQVCKIDGCLFQEQSVYFRKASHALAFASRQELGIEFAVGKRLRRALHEYDHIKQEDAYDNDASLSLMEVDQSEIEREQCIDHLNELKVIFNCLRELDLIESWQEASVHWLNEIMKEHVEKVCDDNFEESIINNLLTWFQDIIVPILDLYACNDNMNDEALKELYATYGRLRCGQLFDIARDFPDSKPALQDLSECVKKGNLRKEFVEKALKVYKQRLLHPGAKTVDIVNQYIATVKSLLVVDPAGHILHIVSKPIRQYLRRRDDTVRHIINKLFDDDLDEELAEDLKKEKPIMMDTDDKNEEVLNDTDPFTWNPDPADIGREINGKRKNDDLLTSLVSIYDTISVFVKEFQSFLSERLLYRNDYSHNVELSYVELLKLRFGENEMHNCEVMLKDIQDSKRLINLVRSKSKYLANFQASVVSYLFWPFSESLIKDTKDVVLPDSLNKTFTEFEGQFADVKRSRKVKWLHNYGKVDLTVTVNGEAIDVSATCYQAIVLHYFLEKQEWNIDELVDKMNTTKQVLIHNINFWISMNVLYLKSHDVVSLNNQNDVHNDETDSDDLKLEADNNDCGDENSVPDGMQVYWQFIVGMLTNLGPLASSRIQTMLSMFVQTPKYEKTENDLKKFLNQMVHEDKLEFVGGEYKLKFN